MDVVEREASGPFEAVRQRIEQAIADAGMVLFARIDHAAGARAAGFAMPETQVLIFGNARAGTPVMLTAPAAALDLPLRLLIREAEPGRVTVSYRPVGEVFRALGVDGSLVGRLEGAQARVAESAG